MKLRMIFLSMIFSIVVVAIMSSVSVAQGCNVDGAGVPPNNLDISDVTYLIDYLYIGGPAPPDYDAADMDEYQIITLNDLRVLGVYMFTSGTEPTCPPIFGPMSRMRDPDNWLELVEDEFPAAKQPLTLHLRLTTNRTIDCINLPLSIMVGHYAPQIDAVRIQEPFTSWTGTAGYYIRGDGKVMFPLANLAGTGLTPQNDVLLAEVDISLTQPHPDALPITIEWDLTAPPVGPYGRSHYPFLFQHHTARQDADTVWIPDLKGGHSQMVPTISEWGLITLLVLLLGGGVWVIIHRRKEVVTRT